MSGRSDQRMDELVIVSAAAEALDRMPFGFVLVNNSRRVLFSNDEARRIVRTSDAIHVAGGRLRARIASEDGMLQQLIEGTIMKSRQGLSAGGAGAVLTGSNGKTPIQILVSPLNGTAADESLPVAVFISDPSSRSAPRTEVLRACFGFSPAEARVVRELVDGRSVSAISAELSLTENTVRGYLKSALAKTGCHSQSALVALLLRSVAALCPVQVDRQ